MFIETETTPNPATIKFIPHGVTVTSGAVADFKTGDECGSSPLARRLFKLDGIDRVYIASHFVAVSKQGPYDWTSLKSEILMVMMDHLMSGEKALDESLKLISENQDIFNYDIETQKIVDEIKALIETRVRPAVAQDGGDIVFSHYQNQIVYLHMRGACSGCPSSTATLKSGIENMLKHYIPEIVDVRPVDDYAG